MKSRIDYLESLLEQVVRRIKPTTPEGEKLRDEIVAALKDSTPCPRCTELQADLSRFQKMRAEISRMTVSVKTTDEERRNREENASIAEADLLADLGLELP